MAIETKAVVDKRITLALVFAVVVETAGALTWAGAQAERLDQVAQRQEGLFSLDVRLARLEEQLADARATLARIEERVEADRAAAGRQGR